MSEKRKPFILLLDSSAANPNEIALWQSIIDEIRNDFEVLLFTHRRTNRFESVPEQQFDPESFPLDVAKDFDSRRCSPTVLEIARLQDIWGSYIPAYTPAFAQSWFDFWTKVLELTNPLAVLTWSGYHIPEASLIAAARNRIPAFYVERGPIAGTYLIDPSGIGAQSSFCQEGSAGSRPDSTERLDRFRKQYFLQDKSNWEQGTRIGNRNQFLTKYGIPVGKVLVFFPLQIDNDMNARRFSPFFSSVLEAYKALLSCASARSEGTHWIIKKHPKQTAVHSFKKYLPDNATFVDDAHIFDCIEFSDGTVAINSGAAAEAVLFGRPVFLLGKSILESCGSIARLESRKLLETDLANFISSVKGRQNPALDYAYFNALLFDYLCSPDVKLVDMGVPSVNKRLRDLKLGSYHQPSGIRNLDALFELLQPGVVRMPWRIGLTHYLRMMWIKIKRN